MSRIFFLFLLLSPEIFSQCYLFIGTYTESGSKGIYVCKFDTVNGKAELLSSTENIVNPSYLTISPDKQFIYSITESKIPNGGSVSAFKFDKKTGKLNFINKVKSEGENPVYVAMHKTWKYIVVGNYGGGTLAVFPLKQDGSILPATQVIKHKGSGINKERQEKSHIHATIFSPDCDRVLVTDLGTDKIVSYPFGENKRFAITESKAITADAVPGSGPRHIEFHPNGKFLYCIEEMSGTVVVYKYEKGKLDSVQRIAAHKKETAGPFASADIHLSPDGKFLYASNRANENNIAIFSVSEDGRLKLVDLVGTIWNGPRNFVIDPSGNFLLVANTTGAIFIFRRDKLTGGLSPTGEGLKLPAPSCLKMMVE